MNDSIDRSGIILDVLDRMEVRLKRMDEDWGERFKSLEKEVKANTSWRQHIVGKIAGYTAMGSILINMAVAFVGDWVKTKIGS